MTGREKARYGIIMTGFALLLLLAYRQEAMGAVLSPLTVFTARATQLLLEISGIDAARAATIIRHSDGFAYDIYFRCTGILPASILAASILAYPGPLRSKGVGLAIGISAVIVVNLLRLVGLFYVGVYLPDVFDIAHSVVGAALMAAATLGVWTAWTTWVGSRGD